MNESVSSSFLRGRIYYIYTYGLGLCGTSHFVLRSFVLRSQLREANGLPQHSLVIIMPLRLLRLLFALRHFFSIYRYVTPSGRPRFAGPRFLAITSKPCTLFFSKARWRWWALCHPLGQSTLQRQFSELYDARFRRYGHLKEGPWGWPEGVK